MIKDCNHCSPSALRCKPNLHDEKPEETKLKKNISRIKHKFVIISGKGGVGKSTVATNIAVALSMAGKMVGLLDVDMHGPSVPRLLAMCSQKPYIDNDTIEPIAWNRKLSVMSLGFMISDKNQAVIWRGPVKMSLIRQFLQDISWGDLDFLIVDCPPGTGDEPLTTLQILGPQAYAVVVTTPQNVAVDDVRRSVSFVRQVGNQIFGIVENMSGFVCSSCGETSYIFTKGGGESLALEMNIRFLGRIPIDPELVRSGEEGFPFIKIHGETLTGKALTAIVAPMLALN